MKLFVATKAMVTHKGKALIIRESEDYGAGTNSNLFDIPGGRLEPGERFDEGLKREINEETGLRVEVGKPFFVNEWRPVVDEEEWQVVGIFFECFADSDKVVLGDDHDAYEWINPADYEDYAVIPNLKPAFQAFLTK